MAGQGVQAVGKFRELLEELLQEAEAAKPNGLIEPPLNKDDLGDISERVNSVFLPVTSPEVRKRSQYAVVETAARDTFNDLLATTTIDTPEFMKLWHLLDIISILSDDEQCDPALYFWLVEELLDSQTIAACRKVFDFLESRRDIITAKQFQSKQLVILRSCNELLRRLSRAEDTSFCGRVFIFLFQSFPLGDKSSVNLRGEFHTENTTVFDENASNGSDSQTMDVDTEMKVNGSMLKVPSKSIDRANGSAGSAKDVEPLTADQLYPIFWSLQQSFSQPKTLFEKEPFDRFKTGVEATRVMFQAVQNQSSSRPTRSPPSYDSKRGTKRKRGEGDDDLANAFNPKYLTSRDLFELEISDLSFRRHILVQVLIVVDFLLSLSAAAKEKLAKAEPANPNKSVMYEKQVLSEDDTKWAEATKSSVLDLLKLGLDGPHFHRMVESVIARDKNWVRWKIENCPLITKPAIAPEEYVSVKSDARKATTNKRLRLNPLGSLNLRFLTENNAEAGLERLKDPSRYQIPSVKSFKSKMELDEMDIEMAQDGSEEKSTAIESKASKSWRALRIASASKLVAFDKIERSDSIDEVFLDHVKVKEPVANTEEESAEVPIYPKDRRPIILAGPSGVGKSTLLKRLIAKYPKILKRKVSHTTRAPRAGEVDGKDYNFITKETHTIMRDGDQFLEYNCYNGNDYGTSRKLVESIIAENKVPLMEMEYHGIQQIKDNGFDARFIFIAPTNMAELERRLRSRGLQDEEEIKGRLKIAEDEIQQSAVEGSYDKIFINDDLDTTYDILEDYIFNHTVQGEEQNGEVSEA
ncbi:hypothetical protein HYFRA_00001279 [Hymenoscyphus fraxineus]|uniref:guanylate kinase n=1 Tax=Hymenoscyphus fraxineus TaxID=746836 RepID=A0A9N9L3P4_9HELO|nr:hypothetical protein HYFRA_00001279 [Hymenoscyphus fraxineus]